MLKIGGGGAVPRSPKSKPAKSLLVNWPDDLAVDLAAFSEAHYGAPVSRIVREAVRQFIDAKLNAEPSLRQRFVAARAVFGKKRSAKIRLLDSNVKPK